MLQDYVKNFNHHFLLTSASVANALGITRREAQRELDKANGDLVLYVGINRNMECLYMVNRD